MMKLPENVKTDLRSIRRTLLELVAGCLIYSLSISCFYSPAHLLGGGVTGIAQLLNYELGVSVSLMIMLINIPLFVLAFFFINRRFTVFSLVGMFTLSFFLQLTSGLHLSFSSPLTSIALGGVLNGLGLGLVYRGEASCGGTDILSKLMQRYFAGNMAYTGLAMNAVIVGISALIYGLDQAVLTICAMYVSSQVTSYIIDGMDHRRAVSIITKKPDKVANAIFSELNRSATVFHGYGAYSREEYDMLYCVITRRELAKLKRCVKECDPESFFTITRLTGVYGHGKSFHSVDRDIQ